MLRFPSLDVAAVVPGALLFGRYLVEERLGQGGIGIVVAARDRVLDRRVALKCLHLQPPSRALAERFLREGRAMARLESAHTVRVFDAQPGVLIMECLRGLDLRRLLEQRGRLAPREAVLLILQACDALAEAHELGIVHRDLKLENLFFTQRAGSQSGGYLKVLDFGLSKLLLDSVSAESTLTETQCVLGSLEYMSPEQSRSPRDVDQRTDIWSLGVVLFALLSGNGPFARRFASEVRFAVLSGDVPALSGVPLGLEDVVRRCLRVDRDERYDSVRSLARDLLPYVGEQGSDAIARRAPSLPSRTEHDDAAKYSRLG